MNNLMTKCSIAVALAGAMTIAVASPSWAAPVLSNTAAVATAAPNAATDVRYYRDGYRRGYRNTGAAIVGGLALGAAGAVAADGYYRNRAYDGPYGYGGSDGYGYAPGYRYAPAYGYAPGYGYDRNWR
jgi:hypothetical protein